MRLACASRLSVERGRGAEMPGSRSFAQVHASLYNSFEILKIRKDDKKMQSESRNTRQAAIVLLLLFGISPVYAQNSSTLNIGSKRELFVDNHIIEKLDNTHLKLHHPKEVGPKFAMDKPWEGGYSGYTTVFKDGDLYRMYYRGYPVNASNSYTCYAESRDGIHWHRPNLNIVEFAGSKDNNIILANISESHNFSVFLDTKPGAPESERYKAIGRQKVKGKQLGLIASSDLSASRWFIMPGMWSSGMDRRMTCHQFMYFHH